MRKTHLVTAAAVGVLALAFLVKILGPGATGVREGAAADAADEIVLNGVLHDFSSSHPDFGVAPASGYGHYAGSIAFRLPGNRRPRFDSGGYRVDREWEDSSARPIAPHLAGLRGGLTREMLGVRVNGAIELRKGARIDAYNSNYGPYGREGNYGRYAVISTNAVAAGSVKIAKGAFVRGDVYVGPGGIPAEVIDAEGHIAGVRGTLEEAFEMAEPALPEDLQPYRPEVEIEGTVTLRGDVTPDDDLEDPALHVGKLRIQPDSIVTVEGDLVIRCDRSLEINRAQIVLRPEATLTIYVTDVGGGSGDVKIKDRSAINVEPGDTTRVTINAIGAGKLEIAKKSHVCATIVAPSRQLKLKDEAHFYGGFMGDSLKVEHKRSGVHVDRGNAAPGNENFALSVREEVKVEDASFIDSFDSNEGPYGGENVGASAWVSTNAVDKKEKVELKHDSEIRGDLLIGPYGKYDKVIKIQTGCRVTGTIGRLAEPYAIPVVAPPALGSSAGDVEYDGGEHVLASALRCKKLKLEHGAILTITGDVTMRIDDKLEIKDGSAIRLDPDATLTLYVGKEIKIEKLSELNANTGNPQLVSVRMMSLGGKGKVKLKDRSRLCAWVQGASAELEVAEQSEFFGSFTGRKVKVKKQSRLHVDMAYLARCLDVLDTAGLAGPAGDGAITSPKSFDQWFRAIPGVNQSTGHSITLTRDGAGIYSYLDDDFHPLDERLLGNEAGARNNHFTYAIMASFPYTECGGQFVELEGGDGAWIFIDGQLVVDLGGVRPMREQVIELDRLGLEDGRTYDLSLFYAQRQTSQSVFRLRTNLELDSSRFIPPVSAQYD